MRQLQFKFDPLPAESAEICLVHERWVKAFDMQTFGQLFIKYVLVFYKNNLVQFCNNYLGGPSQKNLLLGTRKMENGFFVQRKWKLLRQHCLPFQYAPLCTIWDHLNKLCHECGHKIDHLAWKPWIFTHDSSFLRTLFENNYSMTSLLFFLKTWSHIMSQCEGFPIFWFFYARFKMRSKRRTWLFLASAWILEFFWCFSD